jgi:predicted XRE-type DNA-binding protein
MTRKEVRQKIAEYLKANPELTYKQASEALHCGQSTVSTIAREYGITRLRKPLSESDLNNLLETK